MASPLEVDLSCPVCRGFFRDPLLLSCGHSFCHSCLEESWRERGEEEQRCPLCRRRNSRELPPNMALRNVSEAFLKDWQFTDDMTVPLLERQANAHIVPSSPADLRMVLVGKTGSGKSSARNTILGTQGFKSEMSPKSVTKECQIEEVMSGEKSISVTDTPGVYDTDFPNEDVKRELDSFIYLTTPGPHVVLLVIRVGVRFSREEKDAVQWICDNFGKEALLYTIVLFTHTDELKGIPLERYVDESDDLQNLISECEGRFHGFNNTDRNPNQVTELLQKIERMVESNRVRGREYYTNSVYKRAQKQIEDARRLKKAKEVALRVASGVGVAAAVSGGVVLGVTSLVFLPAVLIGVGAATAVGGVVVLAKKVSENMKREKSEK